MPDTGVTSQRGACCTLGRRASDDRKPRCGEPNAPPGALASEPTAPGCRAGQALCSARRPGLSSEVGRGPRPLSTGTQPACWSRCPQLETEERDASTSRRIPAPAVTPRRRPCPRGPGHIAETSHMASARCLELGAPDTWCVREELVDTICFPLHEFSKHLGRLHCGSNSGIQDGQNPPRGRPPVGHTELTGGRLFSALPGRAASQQEYRKGGIPAPGRGEFHVHSRIRKEGWAAAWCGGDGELPQRTEPLPVVQTVAGSSCPGGVSASQLSLHLDKTWDSFLRVKY